MSFGEMGFLFGAAPGVALILRNMLRLRRHVAEAEAVARDSGELLDFNYSASLKSEFLFRPRAFIHDTTALDCGEARSGSYQFGGGPLRVTWWEDWCWEWALFSGRFWRRACGRAGRSRKRHRVAQDVEGVSIWVDDGRSPSAVFSRVL